MKLSYFKVKLKMTKYYVIYELRQSKNGNYEPRTKFNKINGHFVSLAEKAAKDSLEFLISHPKTVSVKITIKD